MAINLIIDVTYRTVCMQECCISCQFTEKKYTITKSGEWDESMFGGPHKINLVPLNVHRHKLLRV